MLHRDVFLTRRAGDKCDCDFCMLPPTERAQHEIVHIPPNTFRPADALPLPSSEAKPSAKKGSELKLQGKPDLFDGFVCTRSVGGRCTIS